MNLFFFYVNCILFYCFFLPIILQGLNILTWQHWLKLNKFYCVFFSIWFSYTSTDNELLIVQLKSKIINKTYLRESVLEIGLNVAWWLTAGIWNTHRILAPCAISFKYKNMIKKILSPLVYLIMFVMKTPVKMLLLYKTSLQRDNRWC